MAAFCRGRSCPLGSVGGCGLRHRIVGPAVCAHHRPGWSGRDLMRVVSVPVPDSRDTQPAAATIEPRRRHASGNRSDHRACEKNGVPRCRGGAHQDRARLHLREVSRRARWPSGAHSAKADGGPLAGTAPSPARCAVASPGLTCRKVRARRRSAAPQAASAAACGTRVTRAARAWRARSKPPRPRGNGGSDLGGIEEKTSPSASKAISVSRRPSSGAGRREVGQPAPSYEERLFPVWAEALRPAKQDAEQPPSQRDRRISKVSSTAACPFRRRWLMAAREVAWLLHHRFGPQRYRLRDNPAGCKVRRSPGCRPGRP